MFRSYKNINRKWRSVYRQRGMTYVELIVVLSIFSIMTSVVLFNYDQFQAKVDIKNLANDIALRIVEAQRSSLSGKLLATQTPLVSPWRPSYGVYFDFRVAFGNDKNFIYFADLDQNGDYSDSSFCSNPGGGDECIDKIGITKNNYISDITIFYQNGNVAPLGNSNLAITFIRPNSEAIFYSAGTPLAGVSYVEIPVTSPSEMDAKIKVYTSGRIQID